MKLTSLCILYFCVLTKATSLFPSVVSEDVNLNFTGLAKKYGHPAEEHKVVTEDGYILTLFHIPGKRTTPLLLMHGTGDHAESFLLRGEKSLIITLAEANYDIWVGNLRGNKYARRHVKLNPDEDPEFWNYSFHEAGLYDLPTTIDYVLNATRKGNLKMIGHSQGTTINFVLLSSKPEYNDKIKLLIALAPVAFLNNLAPPVSTLCEVGPLIDEFSKRHGIEELPSKKIPVPKFNNLECRGGSKDHVLCIFLAVFYSTFFDAKTIEPDFFQIILGHYPGNTSRKTLVHYNQIALRKKFSSFDYGVEENFQRYGKGLPPEYDLQKVTVKTALLIGREDRLATVKDAELIRKLLPNVVLFHLMKPKMWNHIDFIWRNDMNVYLFPTILKLLEKYD
ncbi:lipase 1-like [Cydia splendana]|uniref:lipase 1-like n=1 Tax=Cydia splendana TaxID=1100963 RepID=UPI00211F66A6